MEVEKDYVNRLYAAKLISNESEENFLYTTPTDVRDITFKISIHSWMHFEKKNITISEEK